MGKPVLLDLFSKAGGSAMGYSRAGFRVIQGVDIERQPRYPFEFHWDDAMTYPLEEADFIHASPPCQGYSITQHGHKKKYPKLVEAVRERLIASGLPYVIENVVGAPLINPVTVCGTAFGLTTVDDDGVTLFLRRHRLFESNLPLRSSECHCREWKKRDGWQVGGVYGGARRDKHEARNVRHGGYVPSFKKQQELMGINWMTEREMYEAIPPAYTEFIGKQVLAAMRSQVAA